VNGFLLVFLAGQNVCSSYSSTREYRSRPFFFLTRRLMTSRVTDFQSQWELMLAKRERRFRWYQKHGKVPDGWTPPDPKDPHSRKYPKRALAATLPKKYRMFWPVLLDRPDYELMADSA
jgi:hypothetical protein